MAALSRKSSKAAAAALVMLLALLAAGTGPAAGQTSTTPGCFVGWGPLSILYSVFSCLPNQLGIMFNPFGPPKTDPPMGLGLSVGYYNNGLRSCPNAEQIVRQTVEQAINNNRSIGAALIRLHFHDAFVRGCDASVLLNTTASGNTDTERTGPPNNDSLRGFNVIDDAKAAVEAACPYKVSCADILAFAARDASNILSYGKINYQVPAGRLDGRTSLASETNQLPGPDSTLLQLQAAFLAKGLNLADVVTLSGAHSVGVARCLLFEDHLPDMDSAYAKNLTDTCNAGGPSFRVSQVNRTFDVLDNQYYKNIDKFVLFKSDAALNDSGVTLAKVKQNADDSVSTWYKDFGDAMVKMGKIIDTTAPCTNLEIRTQCWKVNDKPPTCY